MNANKYNRTARQQDYLMSEWTAAALFDLRIKGLPQVPENFIRAFQRARRWYCR